MAEAIPMQDLEEELSERFPVSVIMQRTELDNRWASESWEAIGVTVGTSSLRDNNNQPKKIFQQANISQYLLTDFEIVLHADECESYYHNLMSLSPRCFIIADLNEEEMPIPFLVSLSQDEAHSYLEGDEEVYAIDLPAELYLWSESFVLSHYAPSKKIKRKLKNWKKE
ncbi:MAG: DUF3305 domain-containing protein [Pseudomonadota bacterium]